MLFGLNKLLFFRFVQKKLKLFVFLVSFCFLFSSLTIFAAWKDAVVEASNQIESIVSNIGVLQQYSYLLSKLRSDNRHEVKQGVKKLLPMLVRQKASTSNQKILNCIEELVSRLIFIQESIDNEPLENLRVNIEQHFRGFFRDDFANIEFHEKPGGIQLGQKARITLRSLHDPIDYYVKTHRGGVLSPTMTSGSSGPRAVDPRELFVYRVFELIGLTPETHFFFGEGGAKDFYIATKEAGFDELAHK